MKSGFRRLRGMVDLMPADTAAWQRLERAVRETMRGYGYDEIRTPLLESTALFARSIGEATDIVEKEMYTFPDRKGESLSLRPENTAGCVRAAIENGLLQPGSSSRVWYLGPMFRYERPQLGRQRQFHQAGAEVYGLGGPLIEAELILLSKRLWEALEIYEDRRNGPADAGGDRVLTLEINTLGTSEERTRYRERLVAYLQDNRDALDEDSLRRLERNPLRVLDSKNPAMQDVVAGAPALRDSLSDESRRHFDTLRELLVSRGLEPVENPRLVRGLDYYSHTVFEWTTDRLGAQSAVCAGGRYDGLLEQLGKADTPGVGWAMGLERVVALMAAVAADRGPTRPDVFVIATDDVRSSDSLALAERLREALTSDGPDGGPLRMSGEVVHNVSGGSLKSQFRKADRSGARVAAVIGAEELEAKAVTLKPLGGGEQRRVRCDLDDPDDGGELEQALSEMLKAAGSEALVDVPGAAEGRASRRSRANDA